MKTEISSWLRCLATCAAIVYAAPKVNTGRIEYELQELRAIHKEALNGPLGMQEMLRSIRTMIEAGYLRR